LRCLTCAAIEFKAQARVPVSIKLDTKEGTVTAVKMLAEEIGPATDF
jgi:hypothetical protein